MSGPLFTYTPNVPQASQYIRVTQTPILNNFQAINEWVSVNHVGFSDQENYGKHTFTSFISQGSNPNTTSTEMTIFCASSSGSNPYELYYRYPSNGTIVQLTGTTATGGVANPGYAYISSTVFIMWGNKTGIITGSNVVTFPSGGGFPTLSGSPLQVYYTANVTYSNRDAATYVSATSSTNFTLQVPNSGYATSVYWMIIAQ